MKENNYCDFSPNREDYKSETEMTKMGSVVYFIYTGDDELIYIGQTKNFKRRVRDHYRRFNEEAELIENVHMEYLKFKGFHVPEMLLDEVESFYIEKYLPPYNKDGLPIELVDAYRQVRIAKMELAKAKNEVWLIKHKLERMSESDRERVFHPRIEWDVDGVSKPALEWCQEYNIGYGQVLNRMKYGLTMKQALTFPRVPREMVRHPMEYWKQCGCL